MTTPAGRVSVVLGMPLVLGGNLAAWAGEPIAVAGGRERLALVTFVDRSLKRVPSGGPGDVYAPASDYQSSSWGRRIAGELGKRHKLETVSQWPVLSLGVHCVVYGISDERSLSVVTAELRKEKVVSGVYPMNDFYTLASDPYTPLQRAAADMQLFQAHRFATGRDVSVAVIDTAIDFDHPALLGQISSHADLVNDSDDAILNEAHGTGVAAVIAARVGNAAGIVGVAPAAHLAALRACWPSAPDALDASCNMLTLARAIDTAIRLKARVLNLNLGGPRDGLLEALLQVAMTQGMLVVGAMPVDGQAADAFPTAVAGVIRVGVAGVPRDDSNVMAPGTEVFTTMPHRRYGYMSGSSIAAAHITGLIALLLELEPTLTAAEITGLLSDDRAEGSALAQSVNACAVLARAGHGVDCAVHQEISSGDKRPAVRL